MKCAGGPDGRRVAALLLAAALGCASPLEVGERLYREGDPLAALSVWRATPEDDPEFPRVQRRTAVVEDEFQELVPRYKQRARHFEERGLLAESILNYRLALVLQPEDGETLGLVQRLARRLAAEKTELRSALEAALERGDLPAANARLARLRAVDPFDPELESVARVLDGAVHGELARRMEAGRRAIVAGNLAAAERSFRAVLELDPDDENALGYLSYIATLRRERSLSAEGLQALEAVPEHFASDAQIRAEGFYQNAAAADRAGEPHAAIRHCLRALAADPEHRPARERLAELRERLAGRVDPLIDEGRDAFRSEDLEGALELWRRALLIDPDNGRAAAYIARAERQLANLERVRSEPDPPVEVP